MWKSKFEDLLITNREYIYGLMEGNTRENGKQITCMGRESTPGKMEGDMKENIIMIRNKDMEYTHGQMEGSMQDSGRMGSKVERESIFCRMGWSVWGCGRTERG